MKSPILSLKCCKVRGWKGIGTFQVVQKPGEETAEREQRGGHGWFGQVRGNEF